LAASFNDPDLQIGRLVPIVIPSSISAAAKIFAIRPASDRCSGILPLPQIPFISAYRHSKGRQMLQAVIIPVTAYQQNCTLIWCDETMQAAVIDPGGELEQIEAQIQEHGLTLEKILITHGHIDHAGATDEFQRRHSVPIEGPQREDQFWIDQLVEEHYQQIVPEARPFKPDRWLENNDQVSVGNLTLEVRHCPGHTPGHVIFFHPPSRLAFVGDVLFQGSVGRTDFPRGDHATLMRSIKDRLWPLGDDVAFVCGHGPMSTFGNERRSNPFVRDHDGPNP
jgi:glyoxylase-like metal-dependent hydrolase (beta-lactamase superfamily II)